jgi:hypothetical protein
MSIVPSWGKKVDALSKTLEGRGRIGGSRLTTPSAVSKVASRIFFDAQQPSCSYEGTICSEIAAEGARLKQSNRICHCCAYLLGSLRSISSIHSWTVFFVAVEYSKKESGTYCAR